MKKIDEIINEESISKNDHTSIVCHNCGEDILEDEPCVQVRSGTFSNDEFEDDGDLAYYHRDCFED